MVQKSFETVVKKLISICFCFFYITSKDKCPKYNGYCSCLSNDQGFSIRPKTKIIYMLLLNMLPANPTTMQTPMTQE